MVDNQSRVYQLLIDLWWKDLVLQPFRSHKTQSLTIHKNINECSVCNARFSVCNIKIKQNQNKNYISRPLCKSLTCRVESSWLFPVPCKHKWQLQVPDNALLLSPWNKNENWCLISIFHDFHNVHLQKQMIKRSFNVVVSLNIKFSNILFYLLLSAWLINFFINP